MKVLVVRQPLGTVEGIALKQYRVGRTYDVAPALAEYLVAEGHALIEMRHDPPLPHKDLERRSRRGSP